jgi:uncharacterized membrane protein YeaQ/YmgE (transglycosylase-associated protein family)
MTIFWTIVLGIIGSIMGVIHMFSCPPSERYHPAGLAVSTGAVLVLFIC